jgi:hypothetical protein
MQIAQASKQKKVKKPTQNSRPGTAKAKPSNNYGKFIQQQHERGRQSNRPGTAKPKRDTKNDNNPEAMPVFNEEFLNQLSEEQLQELL